MGHKSGELLGQAVELRHEQFTAGLHLLQKVFIAHDLKDKAKADHIGQIAAEGGVNAARFLKYVVLNLVKPRAGQHPADLRLFAKGDDIRAGLFAEQLMRPELAGNADAGLHFIVDQQQVLFIAQLPQLPGKFGPDVVVAPFALNRFDNNGGNIVRRGVKRRLDLADGLGLQRLGGINGAVILGELHGGMGDPGPVKLRIVERFAGIGRVGEAHGVTGAAVKAAFEMHDPAPPLPFAGGDIFAHLPVERRFQTVFDGQTAPFNEKCVRQVVRNAYLRERVQELRIFPRIDVR